MSFELSKFNNKMLRILCAFLSAVVLASQGSGMELYKNKIGINIVGSRNNLLSAFSHCFYDATQKVPRNAPIAKTKTYEIYLAKNETEYCQIAIRSKKPKSSFIELGEFKNSDGDILPVEMFAECDIQANDGIYSEFPDPLLPIDNNYLEYNSLKETNYVFAIIANTKKDTKPGTYKGKIYYGNRDEKNSKYEASVANLEITVWNFVLDETPGVETAFQIWSSHIKDLYKLSYESEEYIELYKKYYEMLLSHHISPFQLPYDVMDDKADEYMSDTRLTSFMLPYSSSMTDKQITDMYNKISSNPDWFKKAYFYPIDEPHTVEQIDEYNKICDRLEKLFPGYQMVTPFYTNTIDGLDKTNLDIQIGKSNILCPETILHDEEGFSEKIAERVKVGDKSWWYVCNGPAPSTDYCNLFVQQDGLKHRILFWQQYDYNVTGLLYWSTTYYYPNEGEPNYDIWTTSKPASWTGYDTYGDGILIYPGIKDFKIDAYSYKYLSDYIFNDNIPVSSLRLEAAANGIEDYMYLQMAEKLLGSKYVDKKIKKITKNLTHYTYSDKTFRNVRTELGKDIEKASK